VEAGRFRRDLYFRLNVLPIAVPALAEHPEDIPALIDHFCRLEGRTLSFTSRALDVLNERAWPGNVRELRNLVERLLCLPSNEVVGVAQLAEALAERVEADEPGRELERHMRALLALGMPALLKRAIHALVDEALRQTGNNKSAAATLLGVHRKSVERLARARRPS
jgi:DNA-binding NtrC family response regulator